VRSCGIFYLDNSQIDPYRAQCQVNESIRLRLCPLPEAPRTRASEFEVLLSLARRVYDSVRPCPAAFVAYVQASQDLNVHPSQLRDWVKKLSEDPQHAFPGHGHLSNSAWFIGR
jgi:hypothetical protein